MERILKDEKMDADEPTLFQILQAWSNANEEEKDGGGLDKSATQVQERRKRTAEQMTKYISLESINPADLSSTVP
jgi:hypothetical protein